MKKNIIVSGDSFTAHLVEPNIAWPQHLDPEHNVINCSEMASGNALISRNAIHKILTTKNVDAVIIGWSDPNRFELFFNEEENLDYAKIKNHFKDRGGLTNQIITNEWHPGQSSSWLKSGGNYGGWDFESEQVNKLINNYFEKHHNKEFQYVQTIESILRVQWLCKLKNIKLLNFKAFGHDLFDVSYENAKHLITDIDWNTWWRPEPKTLFKGLREWCIDKGYKNFPGSHPVTEAQRQFADEVISPWINND